MDILIVPLLWLVIKVLNIYTFAIFIYVTLSLLEQFGIVNRYNQIVYFVHNMLFRVCEPILARLRLFLPHLGAIDLSPMVLILALYFIQDVLLRILARFPA